MDFNATIDLIIKELHEAREIIDDLKNYPGVPLLQVELAKMKCKTAGEIIALLKSQSQEAPPADKIVSLIVTEDSGTAAVSDFKTPDSDDIVTEIFTPPVAVPEPNVLIPSVTVSEPDVLIPPVTVSEPDVFTPAAPVVLKKEIKRNQKKSYEAPIIADKFNSLSSLNEQLRGNKTDEDVSTVLKTKPLTSLSDGIGLNDKFLFIREIFDGDKEEYARAISKLDKVESLSEALAVMVSYTNESNDNEAINQLLEIVKRKIVSNE